MIREGSAFCTKHNNNNCLSIKDIAAIKSTNSSVNKISSDELMHSFQDISSEFKRIKSTLGETSRRPPITFDDSNRLTNQQYFVLTRINKQSFNKLFSTNTSTFIRTGYRLFIYETEVKTCCVIFFTRCKNWQPRSRKCSLISYEVLHSQTSGL